MNSSKLIGLNTPASRPLGVPQAQSPNPVIHQNMLDLHRLAMGVAMQNLMKRIKPATPKQL